jgi:hypothetical protein
MRSWTPRINQMVVGFLAVFFVIRVGKEPSLSSHNINLDHSTRILDLLLNLHARYFIQTYCCSSKKMTVPSLFFNEKISNDKLSEAEGEKQSELDALCSHMFLFLTRPVALLYIQLPFFFKRFLESLKLLLSSGCSSSVFSWYLKVGELWTWKNISMACSPSTLLFSLVYIGRLDMKS